MPNQIHISVSNIKGTKHFRVSQQRKRLLLAIIISVIMTLFLTIAIGSYLLYRQSDILASNRSTISNLIETKEFLTDEISEQYLQNIELAAQLEDQANSFNMLYQRVDDVESVLGLQDDKTDSDNINQRLDIAAINSATRTIMQQMIPSISPMSYQRISSSYGRRTDPVTGQKKVKHAGIDLTCKVGEKVYAPADGVVEWPRKSNKGYGNLLKIRHAFGFMSLYAHLDKFEVKMGQFVKQGDLIARCGNSGKSTGPHLHYEVRFLGNTLQPRTFMKWKESDFNSLLEREPRIRWSSLVSMVNSMVAIPVQLTSTSSHENHDILTANN